MVTDGDRAIMVTDYDGDRAARPRPAPALAAMIYSSHTHCRWDPQSESARTCAPESPEIALGRALGPNGRGPAAAGLRLGAALGARIQGVMG